MSSRSGVSGVRYSVTLCEICHQDICATVIFFNRFCAVNIFSSLSIDQLKPMTTKSIQTVDIVLSVHKRGVGIEPENIIVVAWHHLRINTLLSDFYPHKLKFWRPAPWSSWRRPLESGWLSGPGWPSGWTSPPYPRWCWCTCLVKAPEKGYKSTSIVDFE